MRGTTRHGLISVAALLVLAWAMLAQAQRGGGAMTMPPVPGSLPAHKFEKVAEGVYFATSTGSITTGSNGAVIVNADDVLIIDPGITAAAGRSFVEDVKTLTNKPVKYVVDTHYHYDHAFAQSGVRTGRHVDWSRPDAASSDGPRAQGADVSHQRGRCHRHHVHPAARSDCESPQSPGEGGSRAPACHPPGSTPTSRS